MNRLFLVLLCVAGLAACASQERTEPPAPIVSATAPVAKPVPVRPVAPPPEETAEVYPYQPPSSAPDAFSSSDEVAAAGVGRVDSGPISERATTAPSATAAEEEMPSAGTSTSDTLPVPAPAPEVVAFASPPPRPSLTPAADTLVKQAEQQRRAKDYVSAAATLERALGIQPQEPYVWNRLARVRMEQGLYAQAGNLASRSNALAGDQATLKKDNWSMIAVARRAAGDTAGAMEAERKARGG